MMKNPFKHARFERILFTAFLLFASFLILLLGAASFQITNQEVLKQTLNARKLLLDEIHKQLLVQMQSIEYDSLSLCGNPNIIHYLQNEGDSYEQVQLAGTVVDQLRRLGYVNDAVDSVQLFTRKTSFIKNVGSNGVFDYSLLEKNSWYEQIRHSDSAWIGSHQIEDADGSFPDHDLVVSFARKVLASSGKEIGVLLINIKISVLRDMMRDGVDGARYILDTNGRVITDLVNQQQDLELYRKYQQKIAHVLDLSSRSQYSVIQLNDKKLMIWSEPNQSQWMLLDIIPWESLSGGVERVELMILIASLISILLALSIAYVLTKQFARPLKSLVQAMELVTNGKLDIQLTSEYKNEFGNLNRHFNQMIDRIRQLLIEVDEQNRMKRAAELQMLQEQINPHFLYNTLDAINWIAIDCGAGQISRMLSILGRMLRISLAKGAAFIEVRQEMEHLKHYIELQRIRYQNTVRFIVSVPDSIGPCSIPKLIIQPFVENALVHGLSAKADGCIEVTGNEDDQNIWFHIRDNGQGMDPGRYRDLFLGSGYGIRNVHERIQLYYGKAYGVHILSNPDGGTSVTLHLPKQSKA